jgi:hypothetical protein
LTVRTGVATVVRMSVRFEMRVDEALMARVDRARGDDETRAAWIKRAIEVVLDIGPGQVVRRQAPEAERIVKDAAVAANRAPAIPGVKSAAELFAEQCQSRADERRRIREGE